jgi:hypothetical protein
MAFGVAVGCWHDNRVSAAISNSVTLIIFMSDAPIRTN